MQIELGCANRVGLCKSSWCSVGCDQWQGLDALQKSNDESSHHVTVGDMWVYGSQVSGFMYDEVRVEAWK